MSSDWRSDAFRAALKMLTEGAPKDLISRAQPEAADRGEVLNADDLAEVLTAANATDPFLNALGPRVHRWDVVSANEEWTRKTVPSSTERRDLVCDLLGLNKVAADFLLEQRPIFYDGTVVISDRWDRWYTPQRADERAFYWPKYLDYLMNVKGWAENNVTSLDLASTQVVERLADPTRTSAYQSKGLVVGYVQSGKTANFTGVAAKAIDAGYRLIIIMTGTIEMLRAQTQRRLDMELVGRQNILGDLSVEQAVESKVDYQHDKAWLANEFLDLGSEELATEIVRLTNHHKDYQKQFRTLKIEHFEMGRPLFDPQNLYRTAARVAVVKKNATVLKKLVTDIRANKSAFLEIPVLIIDDESDQASVNTVDPEVVRKAKSEGKDVKERRAINERIADMLELMPRAQYVGYTATPFANVFTDPGDSQGIFPKDFVIGLDRPNGYMGVDDFHDLDDVIDEPKSFANSNERAFVRHLDARDDDAESQDRELAQAIDMFVLTGAVKLQRIAENPVLKHRHHTMLVHDSVSTAAHRDLADRVKQLWRDADFTNPSAKSRLQKLYETDVVPVSHVRMENGTPALPTFDELAEFIPHAISRITEHSNNPVIVVNSDKELQQQQQVLDFDQYDTWRVLVGGAKLSRGFTVEGLTVTYFRRATNMSDSLTQMGRWFGFREGYKDLVRLYIARNAKFGAKTVDLYSAFQSVALDEAAFRSQLSAYAKWQGDRPLVTPLQIPPLVMQHLPWLQPTASNKMFNAVLEEQSEQPFTPTGYTTEFDELQANLDQWRPAWAAANAAMALPRSSTSHQTYDAFVGTLDASSVVDMIDGTYFLPWYSQRSVQPKSNLYRRLIDEGLLENFVVIAPQPETDDATDLQGVGRRVCVSRDRRAGRGGKFGEITDNKHRWAAESFVTGQPATALAQLHGSRTGAVLLYLIKESKAGNVDARGVATERGLVVGFSVYLPHTALPPDTGVLKFRVHDPSRSNLPTIDAHEG